MEKAERRERLVDRIPPFDESFFFGGRRVLLVVLEEWGVSDTGRWQSSRRVGGLNAANCVAASDRLAAY